MKIQINDDFDLRKIVNSGQCFRPAELEPGYFRFITGSKILYIRELQIENDTQDSKATGTPGSGTYEISCDMDTWNEVWIPYFDLDRNYAAMRAQVPSDDTFMNEAASLGAGIRILNQDPFEMLLSFIISQRKNIPAIRSCVEKICTLYGKSQDGVYLFPTAEDILTKGCDELSTCSLGYRLPYIEGAVRDVASGALDLEAARNLSDDELLSMLMNIKGVGIKVASCIALFAYGRGGIAPVDTWINRIIEEQYAGVSPFPGYGENSGIFQQYAFYTATNP